MKTVPEVLNSLKLTSTAIANAAGVSIPSVTRALRGETMPSDVISLAVEKITAGKITAEQFNAHCFRVRNSTEAAE